MFRFGAGVSYTSFAVQQLQPPHQEREARLTTDELNNAESFAHAPHLAPVVHSVSVEVFNTGDRKGAVTVFGEFVHACMQHVQREQDLCVQYFVLRA